MARLTVYDLSVIPLFLLMGQFATQGGLSRALFQAAAAFVGHIRGGLAMASVLAAGAFGAVCGSSVATSATITQVAYPQMKRHGYHGRFSTATLAASGTLGILIPPSVPLVVYAILTEQNIAKLFAAAMVPGLIAMFGYLVVVGLVARRHPEQAPPSEPRAVARALARAAGDLADRADLPASSSAASTAACSRPPRARRSGAVATFVAALGAARTRPGKASAAASSAPPRRSAMVFMIFLGADMINASLALTAMPAAVADWVGHLPVAPLVIVGAVLVLYIILGGVMDELSMMLLTIPVIFPAIMQLPLMGLAPESKAIWFGILVLMTVSFGLIAPPVGLNVYVVNGIAQGRADERDLQGRDALPGLGPGAHAAAAAVPGAEPGPGAAAVQVASPHPHPPPSEDTMTTLRARFGRPLRLAVIGGGPDSWIGQMHRGAAEMDGWFRTTAGVFSSDPARSRAAGAQLGLDPARSYGDVAEMLQAEGGRADGIDAVAIMTPNDTHYPYAAAALDAGLDVVCDKPVTHDYAQALRPGGAHARARAPVRHRPRLLGLPDDAPRPPAGARRRARRRAAGAGGVHPERPGRRASKTARGTTACAGCSTPRAAARRW